MMIRTLLGLLLLATLSTCTIPGLYYLVNTSDEPLDVRLYYQRIYRMPNERQPLQMGTYDGEVSFRPDRMKQLVPLAHEMDTTTHEVTFVLPPNTYAMLGDDANFRPLLDSLIVTKADTTLRFTADNREDWSFSRKGVPGYMGVLKIE